MKLALNIDGIKLVFGIENYVYSDSLGYNWTNDYISVNSEYINYETRGELFDSYEISILKRDIKKLLYENSFACDNYYFLESDIEFNFRPAFQQSDCSGDILIYFNNRGVITANYISIYLSRENLEILYNYLRLATHEIGINNPIVTEYYEKGMLLNF